MAIPKRKENLNEKIVKLRSSEKWKRYFHNLRPRNEKGELVAFPKITNSQGMSEEDFCKHIDKLVLLQVNNVNPSKSFDKFFKEYKKR